MMHKYRLFLLSCWTVAGLLLSVSPVVAQEAKVNLDEFYRGVKHTDLINILPPRVDKNYLMGARSSSSTFFSSSSGDGCPDEISIGSVDSDTDVFGSVDIEVNLDSDIIIVCD